MLGGGERQKEAHLCALAGALLGSHDRCLEDYTHAAT